MEVGVDFMGRVEKPLLDAALVRHSSKRMLYPSAVYFLGCTEFSSIFLVFIDLAKFCPPTLGSPLRMVVALCGPLFAISFFAYRVFLWWKVSFLLWSDCFKVINNGMAEKLRPGKTYILYIYLVSNILLGGLQLYWSHIILYEVLKLFTQ